MIILVMLLTLLSTDTRVLYDFEKDQNIDNWRIVDDVVMGGRSSGTFMIDENGHGKFSGKVSLENNGGFSSVRYRCEAMQASSGSWRLKIKGDGKRYQIRMRTCDGDYYSYIFYIQTSGEWEEINVPLQAMYPSFRGRRLDMPNFTSDQVCEFSILIANKKAEDFTLLIDRIDLIQQ